MSKAEEVSGLIIGGLAIIVIVALVAALFYGWILMLLLAAVKAHIFVAIPSVGYWNCFWPAVLLRILIGQSTTSKD